MNMITIRPIENRDRYYLAFFHDNFLDAVYSVSFQDSITGAMALNRFCVMINRMYKGRTIELRLSNQKVTFKSQAVLDILTGKVKEEN